MSIPFVRNSNLLMSIPDDPDITLLSDFLAGEMTDAELSAVEYRLESDTDFRRKAEPLIKIWNMPVSLGAPAPSRGERWTALVERLLAWLHALAFPVPRSRGSGAGLRDWRLHPGLAAAIMVVLVVKPDVLFRPVTWLMMDKAQYTAHWQRRDHRAPTDNVTNAAYAMTGKHDVKRVDMLDGSWVMLQPDTRFYYPWTIVPGVTGFVAIDGEMEIHVTAPEGIIVSTWSGAFGLMPGVYAVSAPLGASETRVTVESGQVVRANGPGQTATFVAGPGQHVLIKVYEAPVIVPSGEGFPVVGKSATTPR